jgi:coenzyme F420-reducing hydrogenase beta subunit
MRYLIIAIIIVILPTISFAGKFSVDYLSNPDGTETVIISNDLNNKTISFIIPKGYMESNENEAIKKMAKIAAEKLK